MIVGSELKSAQLEQSADTAATCTMKSKIQYDSAKDIVAVGDGSDAKYIVTSEATTFEQFKSLLYPIGSMLFNVLSETQYQDEMGASWKDVGGLPVYNVDRAYSLIEASTDLGAKLIANDEDNEVEQDGITYAKFPSPSGRYLRASGEDQLGNNLVFGTPQENTLKEHTHPYLIWSNSNHTGDNANDRTMVNPSAYTGRTTSPTGDDETRPESVVYNLYIKVNRI